jgi:phosphoserine phosphatase
MRLAVTLLAARPDPDLTRLAAVLCKALAAGGAPLWLARDKACDIFVDANDIEPVAAAARDRLGAAPVDLLVQPAAGRRKRLLAADLESTIIENEMLDELGAILGIGPQIAVITRQAMNGDIDFAAALAARVALLAGVETRALDVAAAKIRLTAGARTLVATMRRHAAVTALVTGGFTVFADRVAARLGFDRVVANRLEIVGGRLTGRVLPPIVTGETKRQALLDLAAECGMAPGDTLAVGDGANDLPMLGAAGLGVAFRAKPAVAAAARWRIDHTDLGGLLYAQGYAEREFVETAAPHP